MAKKKVAKPKQAPLPGMENNAIQDLEDAAREYVEHRDERMQALKDEVELKTKVLGLMKKHGKKSYVHGDVSIEVVPKEEKIRVKVEKPKGTDVDLTVLDKAGE